MQAVTYEERSLIGMFCADLFVYLYFQLWLAHHGNSLTLIAKSLLAVIAAQVFLRILIAAASRNRLQDERDQLIRLRGYRAGYVAFASFTVIGLMLLWLHAAVGPLRPERMAIHFLSVMFGMLVLADLVRISAQWIAYRRSV